MKGLLIILALFSAQGMTGQIIDFPDANLKNALVNLTVVDTDGNGTPDADADLNDDGEIEEAEAELVIHLHLGIYGISEMTGLEYFINLESLRLHSNQLTELNTSTFPELRFLEAYANDIQTADFSNNLELEFLSIFANDLSTFDMTSNTNLTYLNIADNPITDIDVTMCSELVELYASDGQLLEIDLSSNSDLMELDVSNNQLAVLDLESNPDLRGLGANNNNLSSLSVSHLIFLESIEAAENNIILLDFSQNPALFNLQVQQNNLTSLNIKNGNNTSFVWFRADDNPKLLCIEVDDVDYANQKICDLAAGEYWCKDSSASYSEECELTISGADLKQVVIYPNPASDYIFLDSSTPLDVSIYSVTGRFVKSEKDVNTMNVSDLNPGIYFMEVRTNNSRQQIKLLIE